MRRILYENGLSIVLFVLFALTLLGQSVTGLSEYNEDQREHGQPAVGYAEYLGTGHFIEATFENWESEFLQMAAFVLLTAFLYQKGSSESKEPGRVEEVDVRLRPEDIPEDAPWPVRRGGWVLKLYENSLSIAFAILFILSLVLHAVGGVEEYNQDQFEHGAAGQQLSALGYMATSRFWFESFQNWQSEFLSVFAMVVLTIFLRQRASPESKPVYEAHAATER
ncbi:MAG: hypothetical protein M3416_06600 [Acidobacteriota bacterium]|nr:hypothetical protein [Acidobacteriota bacterium]